MRTGSEGKARREEERGGRERERERAEEAKERREEESKTARSISNAQFSHLMKFTFELSFLISVSFLTFFLSPPSDGHAGRHVSWWLRDELIANYIAPRVVSKGSTEEISKKCPIRKVERRKLAFLVYFSRKKISSNFQSKVYLRRFLRSAG